MIKIYLAGKITGDPDYRAKFAKAAATLAAPGIVIVNPAVLPDGLDYAAYIRISTAMLDECDCLIYLDDYDDSPGAICEIERARLCGMNIAAYYDWVGIAKMLYAIKYPQA